MANAYSFEQMKQNKMRNDVLASIGSSLDSIATTLELLLNELKKEVELIEKK